MKCSIKIELTVMNLTQDNKFVHEEKRALTLQWMFITLLQKSLQKSTQEIIISL